MRARRFRGSTRFAQEATIDYVPSPFGLVPGRIVQRQFLKGGAANDDLMVENDFHYADFRNAIRLP